MLFNVYMFNVFCIQFQPTSVCYNQYLFRNLFAMSGCIIHAFVKVKGKSDEPDILHILLQRPVSQALSATSLL